LKAIIETGKDAVDIAFAAEDFMLLAPLARQKGVTAICDFGVAPGMSNLLAAWLSKQLSPAESVSIYVGGLPKIRKWPFEYKAVFSPSDLVEEYTRPARFIKDGKLVVKPALTDLEIIEFEDIGSLEAFNSDGLRSLLDTLQVPDMIEKTLRYPGHIHKVEVLRDAGFLNSEPIDVNGQKVSPAGLTGKLLFPKLDLEAGEQDITVMRVEAKGYREGKPVCLRYDLFDSYCNETGHHSMGRTTGYAATMAVRMLTEKKFGEKGVIAPEMLANNDFLVKYILKGLAEKGINYRFSEFDL
jgi:saccharopine dehydrogenase-like NADP-dependent oxidoreductase